MLLQGHARLVGDVAASPPAFVALHRDGDQAVVVGRAPRAGILEAAHTAGEILVAPDDEAWVHTVLPTWRVESATLYRAVPASALYAVSRTAVRFLSADEISGLDVPDSLRDELSRAHADGAPIATACDGSHPAAFCYAGSITETLWDVSIDTLEPYRRRGHAVRAVAFLAQHYAAFGKEPVWGALASNRASMALAERLGFTPVDELAIFSAPRVV